jgi:hypothetical protein
MGHPHRAHPAGAAGPGSDKLKFAARSTPLASRRRREPRQSVAGQNSFRERPAGTLRLKVPNGAARAGCCPPARGRGERAWPVDHALGDEVLRRSFRTPLPGNYDPSSSRSTRKPMVSFGCILYEDRLAERRSLGPLSHAPPRITRLLQSPFIRGEPSSGALS